MRERQTDAQKDGKKQINMKRNRMKRPGLIDASKQRKSVKMKDE